MRVLCVYLNTQIDISVKEFYYFLVWIFTTVLLQNFVFVFKIDITWDWFHQ